MESSPIVTFEKPQPHLTKRDWRSQHRSQITFAHDTQHEAFELRQKSKSLKNVSQIQTDWNQQDTNWNLQNRLTEQTNWKARLEQCLSHVITDKKQIEDEKHFTENELNQLDATIAILNDCLSIRDSKFAPELIYDEAYRELKEELSVVEAGKNILTDECMKAWEKIQRLNDAKFKLEEEIVDKHGSITVDVEQLGTDVNAAGISFKPRVESTRSISHNAWLEHIRDVLLYVESEIHDNDHVREVLSLARVNLRERLRAKRDCINFMLRRKVFETSKQIDSVKWHVKKTNEEITKIVEEIISTEDAYRAKDNVLKLAETRLARRNYRPGFEVVQDEPESKLLGEIFHLKQTRRNLWDQINELKKTHYNLENTLSKLTQSLEEKQHALAMDQHCLDKRAELDGILKSENLIKSDFDVFH